LPVSTQPSIADIHKLLNAVKNADGVIKISNSNKPDIGVQDITLYTENQRYLIMLNEIDEEGEHQVRTLTNTDCPNGLESFHGEPFPAHAITRDFQTVVSIFEEFAVKGDVSRALT
jgi:hypothetical protein